MSTRSYDRTKRDAAADLTRRRVLDTARQQFLETGFHQTTVSGLAAAARVSPQTIYNTFGGKAEVLKAVYDVMLAGDDEAVALMDRPEVARVRAQRSMTATLRAYAGMARTVFERVGPLIGVVLAEGAGSDPGLADFEATIERERRIGNSGVIRHLDQRFGLGDRVDLEQATDHVWTLTSTDNADRLVRRCGWTFDAYQDWLASGLVSGLRALRR